MFKFKKFEELCKKHNVTFYKVAKDTGISRSTFYDWKQGKYVPKVDKIKTLANYFNVTIEYFI